MMNFNNLHHLIFNDSYTSMEGSSQNNRSISEPAYLTSANPGENGGASALSTDLSLMRSNYENIFGPAARDIRFDSQRNKRHQRWHLPDNLKGHNAFLNDRIDGLITDATNSPFTRTILPYHYIDQPDRKIKWNVYSFDEGIASRVPYESAARVLPQSKRTFAGYAVRQGLAIAMEHNFMMSEAGMQNFKNQLKQLVGSIQMTNDLDVHTALLLAPSYQKHIDEKYYDSTRTTAQNCRMYVDLFGFMQKNENALDFIIEDAKNHLQTWGSQAPNFLLCNGAMTRQLTMNPEKTNYITVGPDGKKKLASGPDLPSYRGVSIINSRKFSMDAGTAPRDMLRRRVRVSEHYRIPFDLDCCVNKYEFYDQSRDTMFYLSWKQLWKASLPQFTDPPDATNDLHPTTATALPAARQAGDQDRHLMYGTWFGFWPACQNNGQTPMVYNKPIEIAFANGTEVLRSFKFSCSDYDAASQEFIAQVANAVIQYYMNTSMTPREMYDEIARLAGLASSNNYSISGKPLPQSKQEMIDALSRDDVVFGMDLFILRPNIEHHMLAAILGRGGSDENLGVTAWGQTELSCYDDPQHGIFGMSYKYHARALVTNERNLVRVFDVAFDGYTGGNDSRVLEWNEQSTQQFSQATANLSQSYNGPSMIVFSLPQHNAIYQSFPNPVVFTEDVNPNAPTQPDSGNKANDIHNHIVFGPSSQNNEWCSDSTHACYKYKYSALNVTNWSNLGHSQAAGALSSNDESDLYWFSFAGYFASISPNGLRQETQNSGHLGSTFVGCASVRNGRGLLVTGKPSLTHNV